MPSRYFIGAIALAAWLAGCTEQIAPLADIGYQPSAATARPGPALDASVALVGTRPWGQLSLDRVRTATYLNGTSDVTKWLA